MQSHEQWLIKSKNDLRAAKALLKENILDASVYHCQQSAEKAIKAYLSYKETYIIKTHDLEFLVKTCIQTNKAFEAILITSVHLSPYSSKFRYPDDILEPEINDVKKAIEDAEHILKFILDSIKELNTGQTNIFRK